MEEITLDYTALGERIKHARKEKKLTQADLAEECSLSTSYVGHVERGSRIPSIETLFKIATVLDVSLDALVFDSTIPSENLFSNIESCIRHKDKKKVTAFLKTVKALADNIDEL